MNRIRLLPETVANQIAAGEVVERPASVVKELVENAIDADAGRIVVEIEAGGRQLVRVSDDGTGMSRDDALLSLERHATSKIRTAGDLAAITTLGFRGEALPSMASVSRFTLTTRERDSSSPEGSQIVVHGGKIVEVRAAGHAPGTTVEVRQLFFNLPARRKFLRSEETERAHIVHYLTLAALAHPEVGFTLQQEGRLVWQLPASAPGSEPGAAIRDRLQALLGGDLPLVRVDHTSTTPTGPAEEPASRALRVWGFMGSPGVSRTTRQDQHLFVNRRPVENRGLNFALLEGYHTALMKGRYPVCCLFLEIDPAEVDVNVHPAKREVKFRHESAVRAEVAAAVRQALLEYHAGARLESDRSIRTPPPVAPLPTAPARGGAPAPVVEPGVPAPVALGLSLPRPELLPRERWPGRPQPDAVPPPAREAVSASESSRASRSLPSAELARPAPASPTGSPTPLLQVPLRLVGVVGNLYVLLESDGGLVLMDQHAAHERVLFEQMLRRLEQGSAPSQRLLLPETVELAVRDAQFVRENLEVLVRLGVGLSEFGDRTFLLDALPPFVRATAGRQFVLELVDELAAAGREVNSLRLGEHTVAKTVCRHAVKANDPLQGRELEQLLEDLRACAMPYTCPHGRPTLIELSYRELEKKFGRVQ